MKKVGVYFLLPLIIAIVLSGCYRDRPSTPIGVHAPVENYFYVHGYLQLSDNSTQITILNEDKDEERERPFIDSVGDGVPLDLVVHGKPINSLIQTDKFRELALLHETPGKYLVPYDVNMGAHSRKISIPEEITHIDVIALNEYDAEHPKGSSLRDLVDFWYLSYKPFIDNWPNIRNKERLYWFDEKDTQARYIKLSDFQRVIVPACQSYRQAFPDASGQSSCIGSFLFRRKPTNPSAKVRFIFTLDNGEEFWLIRRVLSLPNQDGAEFVRREKAGK